MFRFMNMRSHLVRISDRYAEAVGLSRSRISTIVLNRGATLDRIARGEADITTSTFESAMQWFSDHWPDGADWPQEIPRPSAQRVNEAAE